MSNKSPIFLSKSPGSDNSPHSGKSPFGMMGFAQETPGTLLPPTFDNDESFMMDFDSKMKLYIRTKNSETHSTAELRFEAFAFLIHEEAFLLDVVSTSQPESYIWKAYNPQKDSKKPEPTPAITINEVTTDSSVSQEIKINFSELHQDAKFMFIVLNSTPGYNSYSKSGLEISTFVRRNDKMVYKNAYTESTIKG
jgi:hypothetical protein